MNIFTGSTGRRRAALAATAGALTLAALGAAGSAQAATGTTAHSRTAVARTVSQVQVPPPGGGGGGLPQHFVILDEHPSRFVFNSCNDGRYLLFPPKDVNEVLAINECAVPVKLIGRYSNSLTLIVQPNTTVRLTAPYALIQIPA